MPVDAEELGLLAQNSGSSGSTSVLPLDEREAYYRLSLKQLKAVMVVFESAFQFAFEVPQQATDKTVPLVDLVQACQGVGNARFEATKEEFAKGLDALYISRLLV